MPVRIQGSKAPFVNRRQRSWQAHRLARRVPMRAMLSGKQAFRTAVAGLLHRKNARDYGAAPSPIGRQVWRLLPRIQVHSQPHRRRSQDAHAFRIGGPLALVPT